MDNSMKTQTQSMIKTSSLVVVALSVLSSASVIHGQQKQTVDEQRQAIFQTAKSLFLNRGYGAVSMADIASEAKIDQDTLLSHYASKEVLEDEMLTWWRKAELDNFEKWIADAKPTSDDPLEQTLAFLKNFEDFAIWYAEDAKQPPPGEIWASFIYDHHNHSERVRARIARELAARGKTAGRSVCNDL